MRVSRWSWWWVVRGRGGAGLLLLDETADDALRVVQTPLSFVENQGVCAADDDADCLCCGFDACDLKYPCTGCLDLFYKVCRAEFVFCEGVDVCYRLAASALRLVGFGYSMGMMCTYLADKLDFIPLDIFYD